MKTYRAIRHEITRKKQNDNCNTLHHPNEKISQIYKVLDTSKKYKILELFCGRENLTKHYKNFGTVELFDKKYKKTGDSFLEYHRLIANKKKYDVIDLDPYGFPNRLFPDIYLLINEGYIFITMPKPYVNILNGITQTHLYCYYNETNPTLEKIIEKFVQWGLCHWRQVELIDVMDLNSVWRIVLFVKKVKATEYTGVKNKPYIKKTIQNNQLTIF